MSDQIEDARRMAHLLIVDGVPTIRGEVDLLCAPELERWLSQFTGHAATIDMSDVTFFDSTGLRTFLAARRRNPALRITHPSKAVQRVLEITETADYLVHGRDIIW